MSQNKFDGICPILTLAKIITDDPKDDIIIPGYEMCRRSGCQWWTTVYATDEYSSIQGCAIQLLAGQNSDGKIVV